jgi:hypothetical protein
MAVPGQEEKYANRYEEQYLRGAIDKSLKYTDSETVSVEDLNKMWSSTEVHILKPKQDWKQMIAGWLVPGK